MGRQEVSMRFSLLIGLALAAAPTAGLAQGVHAPGQPMAGIPGGKNVRCSEFLRLGEPAATRVLYFVDGYAAGIADQVAAGTPGTASNAAATDGTAAANQAATTGAIPPATSAVTSAATSATVAADTTAALTALTLDQLHSLCEAQPGATVLSVVPGARPVSSGGAVTANPNATARPATAMPQTR